MNSIRRALFLAFAIFLPVPIDLVAQSLNASLSGTISDSSGSSVPEAKVVAHELRTGIKTTTKSNESGIYVFPLLSPGSYRVEAEKQGFQKVAVLGITLEVSARLTVDLQMQVGSLTELVEVKAEASDNALGVTTSTLGGMVTGRQVKDLPIISRNTMEFVTLQAGVVGPNFAGSRIGSINVSIDGINAQDNRINSTSIGGATTSYISPDRVEEVRVVVSPFDVEYGRGSGQVQVVTRSGTNEYKGSLFHFLRNTALNANTWMNNQRGVDRLGNEISPRNTLIRNNFGGTFGGPIIKNKLFFFGYYEGIRQVTKEALNTTVLTQTARQGTYRFFPGVRNGNTDVAVPTVDASGQPVRPSTATGDLQSVNLYSIDAQRSRPDPSGTVARYLGLIPLPNNFRLGDGLNTAGYSWSRPFRFNNNTWQGKVDYRWNERNTLSWNYSSDKSTELNGFMPQVYPDAPGGTNESPTSLYSFAWTTTLSSRMTNEFRLGGNRPKTRFFAPWELQDGVLGSRNNTNFFLDLGSVTDVIENQDPQGRISPIYQYSNTTSYLMGKHTFRAGAEVRFTSSNGFNSFSVVPRVVTGTGLLSNVPVNNVAGIGLNAGLAATILNDLSGNVNSVAQASNAVGGTTPRFVPGEPRQRTWKQREWGFFFKDDWRVSQRLTVNLGVRWDYYGQPWDAQGRTAALVGGSQSIFGLSGTSFADIYQPGRLNGSLVNTQLVGRNSPNPDTKLYNNDYNNFAPGVGLSYRAQLLGREFTLRTGYGIAYERNSIRNLDINAADLPGLRVVTNLLPSQAGVGLPITSLPLPLTPSGAPLSTVPLTDRTLTTYAFDSNLRSPYTQNFTLGLQTELPGSATFEVRYVGSKGTRLIRGTNVNEINIFENGFLEAFKVTAAGGNAPLFDRMFNGLTVNGRVVNGTTYTGSEAIRFLRPADFSGFSVGGLANFLNQSPLANNTRGGLLTRAGLPENFFVANPQYASAILTGNFANSTYHSLQMEVRKRVNNGLSLQANYTLSRALGEEDGSSQSLLDSYRSGRDRSLDKKVLGFHRTHVFRSNVLWDVPFGSGRRFLSGGGITDKILGGWAVSTIFNAFSGAPINLVSERNSFNFFGGDNTPLSMVPLPRDLGRVTRTGNGIQFFNGLQTVPDPGRGTLTTANNIQQSATIFAVADSSGQILLRNPLPGQLGTLQQNWFEGPGSFRFDASLQKSISITERYNLQFRIDAQNVTNSPIFGNPEGAINSVNFGRITTMNGDPRLLLVGVRLQF